MADLAYKDYNYYLHSSKSIDELQEIIKNDTYDEHNKKLATEYREKLIWIREFHKQNGGSTKKVDNLPNLSHYDKGTRRLKQIIENKEREIAEKIKKDKEVEFKRAQQLASQELARKALKYLFDNKITLEEFDDPEAVARDARYKELIKKRMESGGLFSFGGEDSCEDCRGWDGESRRCECGSRRVSWEIGSINFDENDYIYAQAY